MRTMHWIGSAALVWAGASTGQAAVIRSAEPFVGVTHWQYIQSATDTTPPVFARPIVVNILEIDVAASGISFLMQPGNGDLPGEVTRQTTRGFVNSVGAKIGINGDFYNTNPGYPVIGGQYFTDVNHMGVSNGNVYSPAAGGEPVFNISASNVPGVFTAGGAGSSGVIGGTPLYNAIGGNQRILTNGVVTAPNDSYTNTLNPHTAIATNADRTRVYLMTVDGRQNGYSEGMRTTEMATLFLQFGATDAVNLDGGGSTTMVMDDSNDNLQNARLINSPSDGATPQQAGNERLVANNLAVFALHNPNYVPLPPIDRPGAEDALPRLQNATILDSFEGSKGRFSSAPSTSGSNRNIATTSSTTVDTQHKQAGNSSLRVNIVNTNASTQQMQLRLLSGGGSPSNNTVGGEAVGPNGYIGFFLRLEPGNDPLYVSMLLDDGLLAGHGTERAAFKPVIADGEWHLYEWALTDPNVWANFSNGNARIDGPNVFIDSIYFSSAPATSGGTNWSGTVWIDTVAYNPNGSLSYLVPEPGTISLLLLTVPAMLHRRRR